MTQHTEYEFPEGFDFTTLDLQALDGDELEAAHGAAIQQFNAKAASDAVTTDDLQALRALSATIDEMRTEQADRIHAAEQAAAEIDELASKVRGESRPSARDDEGRHNDGKFKPGNSHGPDSSGTGKNDDEDDDPCEECGKAVVDGKRPEDVPACRECEEQNSEDREEEKGKDGKSGDSSKSGNKPWQKNSGSKSSGSKSSGSSKSSRSSNRSSSRSSSRSSGSSSRSRSSVKADGYYDEPDVLEGEVVQASAGRRLDLSRVRRRTPQVLPEPEPQTVITAAVDVPGYTPGADLDFSQVTQGIISRANALKTAGGGVGQVISYRHPYKREQIVADSSSAPEGTTVAMWAQDQRNLDGGDLVASGGWCAPSEQLYDLVDVACPDMLWDAPEIQLARGGVRFFMTPSLDVSEMTFIHTELDDISGKEKPCYKIPCPDPVEVRCDAVGVCLEAGILTQRHFPELVSWYLRNAMVAHEIRIRQALFEQVVEHATVVKMGKTFGALSAIFEAVALQAADMTEKHSLCEGTALEVVFPWWAKALFLADLARRGGGAETVDEKQIDALFATAGVKVQFARGLSPAVPEEIGGKEAACAWPEEVSFLMYPAGSIQIGRGEEVNLGAIHDSAKFKTNDYTALFTEECVAAVIRAPEIRNVVVPVCPDGAKGASKEISCPVDCEGGNEGSDES